MKLLELKKKFYQLFLNTYYVQSINLDNKS